MLLVLAMTAVVLAQDPSQAVFVADGATTTVDGPVHVIPQTRMDILLAKVQDADDFKALLDEALEERDSLVEAKTQLEQALESHNDGTKLIAVLDAQVQSYHVKLQRRTHERNIAIAVAATAVVVIGSGAALTVGM